MTVVHQSGSAMPVQNEESDSDDGLELLAVQQEDGQPSTKVRRPTMRLLGWVGKHQALILVDSGSASTFIRTCFAEKCGLPMEPSEYSQFTKVMQLSMYDIILGAEWLEYQGVHGD
jgi:hypothetical protein